jgi:hypothetical protein
MTAAGMEWIETAGFRALPPTDQPALTIMSYDQETEANLCAAMFEDPCSAAVVRFNMSGRDARNLLDLHHGGPWDVKAERIPEFNGFLRGSVAIVARRDGALENAPVKSKAPARSA